MNNYDSEYLHPSTLFQQNRSADMVEEITLKKISNLEDEYSKMKQALLSSMESDEDSKHSEDDKSPANTMVNTKVVKNISEKHTINLDQKSRAPTRIDSRSFLDETRRKDLSRTHGKLSTVDDGSVELAAKLGSIPCVEPEHETGPASLPSSSCSLNVSKQEIYPSSLLGTAHSAKGRIAAGAVVLAMLRGLTIEDGMANNADGTHLQLFK